MKRKLIPVTFVLILIILASVFAAGCKKTEPPGEIFISDYEFVAEVGRDYIVPMPDFDTNKQVSCSIFNAIGEEVSVVEGKAVFPFVGSYTIIYSDGKNTLQKTIEAVDTEAPRFDQLFEDYYGEVVDNMQVFRLNGYAGDMYDLSQVFKAKDNSGSCTVAYTALKGGEKKADLIGGKTLYIEPCDYYTVVASAVDGSGNVGYVRYMLIVERRSIFYDFDFMREMKWWLYHSADQYNAKSLYLRDNAGLDHFAYGTTGYSLRVRLSQAESEGRILLNLTNNKINLAEAVKIHYRVYADVPGMTTGQALNINAVPALPGCAVLSGTPKNGEWTEIVADVSSLTGSALVFEIHNSVAGWGAGNNGRDYTLYLDEIALEFRPQITLESDAVTFSQGASVKLSDLKIDAVDADTGAKIQPVYTLNFNGSAVDIQNETIVLGNTGLYTLNITATSAKGHVSEKTLYIISGSDTTAPVITPNTAYSDTLGYYMNVAAGHRLRLENFLVSVNDDFEGSLPKPEFKIFNNAGIQVNMNKITYGSTYNALIAVAGEKYTIIASVADHSGNKSEKTVTVYVGTEKNAASFDLLDVANTAAHELWINDSLTVNHTYEMSAFSKYGFGYSYKSASISAGASIGLHNDSLVGVSFTSIKMWVYISSSAALDASDLAALTPKPKAPGWTCTAYPAAADTWTLVEFTSASYTQTDSLIFGGLAFGGSYGNATVYIDNITIS